MFDELISKEDETNIRIQVEELIERGYVDELRKEEIIKGKLDLLRQERKKIEANKPKPPFSDIP